MSGLNAMETMQNGPSSETWFTADQEISIYSYVKLPRGNVIQGCAQHFTYTIEKIGTIKTKITFFSCLWWSKSLQGKRPLRDRKVQSAKLWWSNTEFFAICAKLVWPFGDKFPHYQPSSRVRSNGVAIYTDSMVDSRQGVDQGDCSRLHAKMDPAPKSVFHSCVCVH